ncbi:MAG: ADP-glyceromanno-heptose 6-epimerase [Caulobacterales bacterium]|jgi:ADP-L-glycero-D-manno-heptose 6-epimerase
MAVQIIITGGAGFIGSNLAHRLGANGAFDVVVVDRLRDAQSGKWKNLSAATIADLVHPDDLSGYLAENGRDIAAVVHLGAISATTETDVDRIVANNFTLSKSIWHWCTEHKKPLIYASSAATYGGGELGFVDDNAADAIGALRPLNAYGYSKRLFDEFAVRQSARGHAPPLWSGLRFFNVYGPNEQHKRGQMSVVAHMYPKIAAGEPVRLFRSHKDGVADGEQLRDFISVHDTVDVMEWLLTSERATGIVNVGTGQARSFLDLAKAAFAALDKTPAIEFIDTPEAIRANYQYFTQADLGRLRELGFEGQFTGLEEGVTAYIKTNLVPNGGHA